MKRLLSSVFVITAVTAAVVIGGTSAFFNDTESSTDNILQAGALDLKIDSQAHYDWLICTLTDRGYVWQADNVNRPSGTPVARPELIGQACEGTWELKDLVEGDRFVNLTDIKPGDFGENTISWHVFDNDAWGRIVIQNIEDLDNSCNEPELEAEPNCGADNVGELSQNLDLHLWLDDGQTPGFQCYTLEGRDPNCDPTEGDNVQQTYEQDTLVDIIDYQDGEIVLTMAPALAEAWTRDCSTNGTPLNGTSPDGHNNYGLCHGLAKDGRLVGSATYYMGVAWELPASVGNEVQTDSLSADITFEVEQHRNNRDPFEEL